MNSLKFGDAASLRNVKGNEVSAQRGTYVANGNFKHFVYLYTLCVYSIKDGIPSTAYVPPPNTILTSSSTSSLVIFLMFIVN